MTSVSPVNTTATQDPYTFARPAAAATRNLISSNPPSNHQSGTATPSDPTSPHGTLHRRKTNNYESALADRLKETISTETSERLVESKDQPIIASGLAYRGEQGAREVASPLSGAGSPTGPITEGEGRPLLGVLGRQQSFKQGDQKRANMERMLSTEDVGRKQGYTTSVPTTPA